MIKGLAALALAHPLFPVQKLIKEIPRGWAIEVFDVVFGAVNQRLRTVLDSQKVVSVVIQAFYSKQHTLIPIIDLKKQLPSYERLAKDYPLISIFVSHSTEYRESNPKPVKDRIDLIKSIAPTCIPLNSPETRKEITIPGVMNIRDGNTVVGPHEINSLDGTDIRTIDAKKWLRGNKDALMCFGWILEFNMKHEGDPYIPPKQRTHAPTQKQIREVVNLMK